MSNLAVAANPPVHTGPAPALAGVSSPIATGADAAGPRGQRFPHSAISSHGPTGAACRFCCKSLTVFNQDQDCPERERIERNQRRLSEINNLEGALRGFVGWAKPLCALPESDGGLGYYARESVRNAMEILARIDGKA